MNKRTSLAFSTLLIAVVILTPFFTTVQAEPRTIVTRGSYNGKWYTQINVFLGDANNRILIPDEWNGDLVVFCGGYEHTFDPNSIPLSTASKRFASYGYATAASNYGTAGYCVKEGMIRTHQLTEYVMNNYGDADKVYIIGVSMGGNIALNLGAKYPELYDGVLDIYGTKNLISNYEEKVYLAGILDDAALQLAVFTKYGGTIPLSIVPGFRSFCLNAAADIELACGGTPEEKPQAYERLSPTFCAVDITVPTITVHGTIDVIVPYSEAVEFMNNVEAAGCSDMYRLYKVVGGGHSPDLSVSNKAYYVCFWQLVDWVEDGISPSPSDP